jgi:hypothetical protein
VDVVRREVSRSKRVFSDDVGLEATGGGGGGITGWDWRGGLHSGVNSLCPWGRKKNPSCFLLEGASRNENENYKLTFHHLLVH